MRQATAEALRHQEDAGEQRMREHQQRLLDLQSEGKRAALLGLGAGLASEYDGEEFAAFVRGFAEGAAIRASKAADVIRTNRLCHGCTCGGRGACTGDHP